ncbi:MAG: DMT family transporter [Alphaproteobacteria bacterium]|nr:DMT family transporter [Alphaproteobacteria bacterium]
MIWVVPLVVGTLAVIQGGLNRMLAERYGLVPVVGLNAVVFGLAIAVLGGVVVARPDWFPASWAPTGARWQPKLWHVVPGLCGFALVAGIPWAIGHLGAVRVFVGIVVAQVVASALWDGLVEGTPPTPLRIAGAVVAILGVVLASWR